MSVYATWWWSDADEHDSDCGKWLPLGPGEDWTRLDPDAVCTCRCGPVVYQASHVLPTVDDRRDGMVSLSVIPAFVPANRAGQDYPPELDDQVLPWLRLSVLDRSVLLDADQVRAVHTTLTEWLERVVPDA